MEQQHLIFIGTAAVALILGIYLIWGPSPHPKKKKGAVVGLVNLGSTCFVNTLLQALASCALFVEWLDSQCNEEKSLTTALHHVLWVLNGESHEDAHSPDDLLAALRRHGWVLPPGEQDAHELFHCIVTTLQEENKKNRQMGSLSDALPQSDTLSQTSEILEDPFEAVLDLDIKQDRNEETQDRSEATSDHNSGTFYEDATSNTKNDSDSQSLYTQEFFSIDSGGSGDNSNETLKFISPFKTNLVKTSDKLRLSEDTIKRGICERSGTVTPPLMTADSPPFQGLLASSLQCVVCGNSSLVRTDTFDSLSLTLGDATLFRHKLSDLLRQFVRTEIVSEVHCDKCGVKTHALKTYNFGKLPTCLCLHVARTAWSTASRSSSKRDDHVDYPEYLVMDPFTWKPGSTACETPPPIAAKHLYRLKSVVVHVGSANSGHFITFRRGALKSNRRHGKREKRYVDNERWYMASDETVQLSSMKRAMDSLAYMLFYEKCFLQPITVETSTSQ